jgi:nucleotide-binding universal stress UspA family protein
MFERIVVALDGSEVSETALHTGAELARRLEAPLHLVRVADIAVIPWGASEAAAAYAELSEEMTREKTEAARYLEEAARRLHDEGITATTEVRTGFAARELAAAVTPGDLLVVASRGRHGLERLLLGSVAEEVARRSPSPVLIARGAKRDDSEAQAD